MPDELASLSDMLVSFIADSKWGGQVGWSFFDLLQMVAQAAGLVDAGWSRSDLLEGVDKVAWLVNPGQIYWRG